MITTKADRLASNVNRMDKILLSGQSVERSFDSKEEFKQSLSGLKICRLATVPYFMVFQLKIQAEYLRDLGMQVVLVSSSGLEWSQIRAGGGLSAEIIPIPRSLSPWKDFIALVRLIRFFIMQRFDIVHSTTPKAGLLTAIAAFLARVPVRLHTFTGQPWVALKGPMRWGSRSADRLIGILDTRCYADSGSQAKFLVDEGIISTGKLAVIGKGSLAGVDTKRFDPDRWSPLQKQKIRDEIGLAPSARVLIFIGRISQDKGIAELIGAFSELLRLQYDLELLLVGPHDQDCGGAGFLDLSEAKQCRRIHYTGYTECPERYLAVADIFCLPSYREGFGTVVIEAAAMGLPTVGTAIYGLTDAVVDGETGILVPPRDQQTLQKAFQRLLDNPDTLKSMGKAARSRCLQYFDSRVVNEGVAKEYARLLKMEKGIADS